MYKNRLDWRFFPCFSVCEKYLLKKKQEQKLFKIKERDGIFIFRKCQRHFFFVWCLPQNLSFVCFWAWVIQSHVAAVVKMAATLLNPHGIFKLFMIWQILHSSLNLVDIDKGVPEV